VNADPSDRYKIIDSKTGALTIQCHHDDGRTTVMSGDGDPIGSVQKIMSSIDASYRGGTPLGLASIGDGYLLAHLAANPPQLILGRQQAIVLMEPDPQLLLACLMLHDYTGAAGPIEQQRIRWYVGSDWARQLRDDFFDDLMLNYPQVTLKLGLASAEIDQSLREFLEEIAQLDARLVEQIKPYAASLTSSRLAEVFSDNPPRRPRVLVVTTRFSTVLQYSARDTLEAFKQLNWDTKLIIEPSAAHGTNRIAIRAALAEFQPDLVFLIDHLRHEYGAMYPANLPVVCWVQDHLPNLTNKSAGQQIGPRDFVLIPTVQRYVANYAYPAEQCLEFRKLTRVPNRPTSWTSDGDDLVYVSNWSQQPQDVAAQASAQLGQHAPPALIDAWCRRIIMHYEAGKSFETPGEIRKLIEQSGAKLSDESKLVVIRLLFEQLNVCLYRQQGLAWAVEVAEREGLRLSIYGNGWNAHPRFGKYARGVVAYGAELEERTRRSKINLVLEPYIPVQHQRLLDGLVAGGFFLLRSHPYSRMMEELIDLLATDRNQPRLDELLREFHEADASPGQIDFVSAVRAQQEQGFLPSERGVLLPDLHSISFDSPQRLAGLTMQFLSDEPSRRRIADAQRNVIEQRYTYVAGMRRLVQFMHQRISQQKANHRQAA
jgi:hypothetical protein